jgi:PhzF family phenazine biosynthesis protein
MPPLLHVDAFTAAPFAGNPAAVCFLDEARDARWMQSVAAEMNLSETAFLVPPASGDATDAWSLRWFSPSVEIDLCGHATLASAHALWETERIPHGSRARFDTRSGELGAARAGDLIELDFPASSLAPVADADAAPVRAAIGVDAQHPVLRTKFDYFVELADEGAVLAYEPDVVAFRSIHARGVIVTAAAKRSDADFVSRFFAPGAGIDEDPVTGSAHCALAPFWAARFGRTELTGYQASPRGGTVRVRVVGDRVMLGGHAVTVLRGELLV